tara:strand:- start:519 stop:764 length:246 start_codon:yes stop_codon:yes gene_type:complete
LAGGISKGKGEMMDGITLNQQECEALVKWMETASKRCCTGTSLKDYLSLYDGFAQYEDDKYGAKSHVLNLRHAIRKVQEGR